MYEARMRTPITGALALMLTLLTPALAGCPSDPYESSTWVEKLNDKAQAERALTELGRLKEPSSIKPLGEAWRKHNYPVRILRVMIDVADQRDRGTLKKDDRKYINKDVKDEKERAEVAEKRFEADRRRVYGPFYEKGPYWEDAIPFLQQAIELFIDDDNNDRLTSNATVAVDALGRAKEFGVDSDVEVIIKAATVQVPPNSKANKVRIAALRALGKWADNPRAADTLVQVLETKPEDQHPVVFAAAADAIGFAHNEKAIDPLIKAMYELPQVYPFVRRSLVAIGKPAIKPLLRVFTGKHKIMNAFAKEHKFNIGCAKAMGPKTKCRAPKALETKAANILGDLMAREAIPAMLAELKQPATPSGWAPNGQPFTFQHKAIFVALRKMGANPKVAAALLAYVKDPKQDDSLVTMAIDTYSFVTRDTSQLGFFRNIMEGVATRTGAKVTNETRRDATDPMLVVSSIAYSRLANKSANLKPFKSIISKNKKTADSWEKKFTAANKKYEKQEPGFTKYKKEYLGKAKKLRLAWQKVKKNADLKKDKPEAYEKLKAKKPWYENMPKAKRAAYQKKKKAFEAIEFSKNDAENKMNQARGAQRTAEQNMARILVGIQCKSDPACYIGFTKKTPDDIAKTLEKAIPGASKWEADAKKILRVAALERSLLELAKLGAKARAVVPDLLELLPSTERLIREGALLALPNVAKLPCEQCVTVLDKVIQEAGSQTTLNALTSEARVWRNYYRWAGK